MTGPLCTETETLGTALPKMMAHVRDDVLPCYELACLKGAGRFAAQMMRADLDAAAKALAEGDVVAMLRAYQSLKDYKV